MLASGLVYVFITSRIGQRCGDMYVYSKRVCLWELYRGRVKNRRAVVLSVFRLIS